MLWATLRHPRKQVVDETRILSVCDLVENSDRYLSTTVRVRGTLVGYHELLIYDGACLKEGNNIRVELNADTRRQFTAAAAKLNDKTLQQGNFLVEVILVGRFERDSASGNTDAATGPTREPRYVRFPYRLVVSTVERVASPNLVHQ